MREVLGEVGAVLDRAVSSSVWSWSDAELVDGVDRLQVFAAQLASLQLAVVAELDARGVPAGHGASSTTAWLRDRCRVSGSAASRMVRLARAVGSELPGTAEALAGGVVNVEQAGVIAAAVAELPVGERGRAEALLLEQAAVLGPRDLGVLRERLFEVIDPAGAAARTEAALRAAEERARVRRGMWLTPLAGTGQVRLTGWLPTEAAAIVSAALDPLCAPRTTVSPRTAGPSARGAGAADDPVPGSNAGAGGAGAGGAGAGGGGAGGGGAGGGGAGGAGAGGGEADLRTAAQRRLDALIELCTLALNADVLPEHGGTRPHLTILIDFTALRAQLGAATLDDGGQLSAATTRRLACDAHLLPAVLDGHGQILDLGRERRLFTGPIRAALVIRDRGCAFPSCDRPPKWCEGHHIVHWADGGPTNLGNAVLVCGHHHRLLHHSPWRVQINAADGLPEFIPPTYIDQHQRPQRNPYHHRRQ
jgi:hypothetical protein